MSSRYHRYSTRMPAMRARACGAADPWMQRCRPGRDVAWRIAPRSGRHSETGRSSAGGCRSVFRSRRGGRPPPTLHGRFPPEARRRNPSVATSSSSCETPAPASRRQALPFETRRNLYPAGRRRHRRIRGRVPERRSDLPQRVLAFARRELQPRTLSARGDPARQVRPPRRREGVLRDPFAHERHGHGLRSPVVRCARRDGRFQLPPAPAGKHQITAWHERLGDTTINVRLEAGRPLETDFTLPVPEKGSHTPVR